MKCCRGGGSRDEERSRNAKITKEIKVAQAGASCPVVLFLGTGESGKSTFYRQLRILHGGSYTAAELTGFAETIHTMLIEDAVRIAQATTNPAVLTAFEDESAPLMLPESTNAIVETVQQWSVSPPATFTSDVASTLSRFWNDSNIKRVYEKRKIFHLGNHVEYFMQQVDKVAQANWRPDDVDLVHFRVRTTGILDQKITLKNQMFRIVDVGGQRSERRKWISQFGDVSSVVFVVAVSEYDQTCWEDNSTNRISESLTVFGDLCRNPALGDPGVSEIIVFFNKTDLFQEKLKAIPFGNYVPGYTGDGSLESASAHIKKMFEDVARDGFKSIGRPDKRLYTVFTTAVDPDNVKKVWGGGYIRHGRVPDMDCCVRSPDRDRDRVIAKQIAVEQREASEVPQVLLLGTGESGKSTLFRQLRLLHGAPYSSKELEEFAQTIRTMIIADTIKLVSIAELCAGGEPLPPEVEPMMACVKERPSTLTPELAVAIAQFWATPLAQKVFLDKVAIIAEPSWTPSRLDLVNFRVRTTGVLDQKIVKDDKSIRLVDVGGQRSERRKWIGQFSGVTAVLFVVAASEYDQKCFEDNATNRLEESMAVFKEIVNNEQLANAGLVVFFNKTDMLKKKLKTIPFKDYVPAFPGENSFASVSTYLSKLYQDIVREAPRPPGASTRSVQVHFTTAIDPDNIALVFDEVTETIIKLRLSAAGIM
ncbi:hypothetical protein PBRA_000951 [Plasmodiophora brassicae]|uniref:Uncharacterized protein n=2 Tax=Plasmodiophora brassicae TaxID=37360 RepID=A0A0G4IQW1_PLABS|nr:hypothetical protein PBRA_000951 [Plasmodiophora brassicae]